MFKKTFFSLIAIAISLNCIAQQKYTSNINLQKVKGVIINGATEVKLTQNNTPELSVIATPEIRDQISITIDEQGHLTVNFGSDISKFFTSKKNRPNVYIALPKLEYLKVTGAANVICSGIFKTNEEFKLITNGKSFVEFLNVNAPKINVASNDVSKVSEMKVNTNTLVVNSQNVASVQMLGTVTENTTLKTQNTASINTLNLKCPNISAIALGMSAMKVHVETKAHVECGGTSSFKYTGLGAVTGTGAKKM